MLVDRISCCSAQEVSLIFRIWFWPFLSSLLTPGFLKPQAISYSSILLETLPPGLCLYCFSQGEGEARLTSLSPSLCLHPQSRCCSPNLLLLPWASGLSTYQTSVPLLASIDMMSLSNLWPENRRFWVFIQLWVCGSKWLALSSVCASALWEWSLCWWH